MSDELSIHEGNLEIIGGDSLAQITRAETDCQITTAKRYPRDFSQVKKKMLSLATLDEETAATCFYKLNRQGKSIEGPSVRMAEIAISCFQNIRAGARIINNDGKTITAQGFCHDLENNVMIAVEVKRRITNKDGVTYSEDMQVVTGNAACAIAFRNAAYKVVPMALIKPVYEAAKQCAVGDIKTLADRRTAALKYFASLGVNEKTVLAHLGKTGVDGIDLGDVETMIGLATAIKDGTTTVDEAFSDKPIVKAVIEDVKPKLPTRPKQTAKEDTKEEPVKKQEVQAASEPEQEPESKPEPTPKRDPETESSQKAGETPAKKEPSKKSEPTGKKTPSQQLAAFVEEGGYDPANVLAAFKSTFPRQANEMTSIDTIPEGVIKIAMSEPEEFAEEIRSLGGK